MRRSEFWILGILLFAALARDFLANGRPLYCRIQGEALYPGLRTLVVAPEKAFAHPVLDSLRRFNRWHSYPYESAVFAPIPFSAGEVPGHQTLPLQRPGEALRVGGRVYRHWLGTDNDGRDVAAGVVSGARIAVQIGTLTVLLALLLGILSGGIAALWGDDSLKISRAVLWSMVAGFFCAWFWNVTRWQWLADSTSEGQNYGSRLLSALLIMALFAAIGCGMRRWSWARHPVRIPADMMVMRLAEIFRAIPRLIFVIALATAIPGLNGSVWRLVALIGILSWPGVAVFIRAELLRIRALDYIAAARGLGASEVRVLLRHALPNALPPLLVQLPFLMKSAMLLEASLSFLGYGDESLAGKSWGNLLMNAREAPVAWWISLPPGSALIAVVVALNLWGERYHQESFTQGQSA